MKTTRKIGLVTALLVSAAISTQAQTANPAPPAGSSNYNKEFRLSVGPDFGLPISDLSQGYNWSAGGFVQADIPVIQNLYVTVNAGYRGIFSKSGGELNGANGQDLQTIPLKAGLKYFFVDNLLYVQGQAGATILANKNNALADKSAGFTYSPQVGVLIKLAHKNYLDAGVYWESTQSFWNNGPGTLNMLGLRLAYTLGL
jgi:hypothetical protein